MASSADIMAEIADLSALLTSASVPASTKNGLVSSVTTKIKALREFPPGAAGQLLGAIATAPFDPTYKEAFSSAVNDALDVITGLLSFRSLIETVISCVAELVPSVAVTVAL